MVSVGYVGIFDINTNILKAVYHIEEGKRIRTLAEYLNKFRIDNGPYFCISSNLKVVLWANKLPDEWDVGNIAWGKCVVQIGNISTKQVTRFAGNINPYKLMAKNSLIPSEVAGVHPDTIYCSNNDLVVVVFRTFAQHMLKDCIFKDFEAPLDQGLYDICFK